jgi:hypothetical protein
MNRFASPVARTNRSFVRRSSVISLVALSIAIVGGCAASVNDDDAVSNEVHEPSAAAEPALVPAAMQPRFEIKAPGVLSIDAREGRFLMQLEAKPRRFESREAFDAFVRETLGATARPDGTLVGRTEQSGELHHWDEAAQVLYRVTDPIAATIGGLSGEVLLGQERLCFDADGTCDGLPSYLEPVVNESAPSTVRQSGGAYDVESHSFYHNVFGYYLRAGGNTKILRGDPWGALDIRECTPDAVATPTTQIESLTIDVRTGGDDLREGQHATAVLTLTDGTVFRQPMNGGRNWKNNSIHSVAWRLPMTIRASQIRRFGIETNLGGGVDGDNWNVDRLAVRFTGPATARSSGTLLVRDGRPFMRFTGDVRTWSTPVDVTTPAANTPISRVFLTIRTGGDDLRGGNDNAFARLVIDGRTTTASMINRGARWADRSTNVVELGVPSGTTFGNLRALELSTTFGGGIGGDNWNVDEVLVEAESGGARRVLAQLGGTPLVRFTGERRDFRMTFPVPGGPRLCALRRPSEPISVGITLLETREGFFPPGVREVLPVDFGQVVAVGETSVEHAVFSLFGGNTSAPEGAVNTAVGVCSNHSGPTGNARTGAGDQRGFCD